jgi:transmembrane sensor
VKAHDNDMMEELMARYLTGEASAQEQKQLFTWIDASSENETNFKQFKKVFELSDQYLQRKRSEEINIDVDNEWAAFSATVENRKMRSLETDNDRDGRYKPWMKMAAAIVLLVASALGVNYFVYKTSDAVFQSGDVTLAISLPDGSKVTLNRKSKLTHSHSFNDETRVVELDGEAFFDVASNPSMPFIIQTKEGTVEVTGTSFNVEAYDSTGIVEVVVETGVVIFSVPAAKTDLELTAGNKAVYQKQTNELKRSVNDDVNFRSWETQKIVFTDAPLRQVVETLNKTYNANISVSAEIPESCMVTVTFDKQSLDAVLRVLENTLNLVYTVDGNKIEISSAGC